MNPLTSALAALSADRLRAMHRGVEKESLRVDADGKLALTPHPAALGSPLMHPNITTDFSESQPELVTGVRTTPWRRADRVDADSPRPFITRSATRCWGGEHAVRAAGRREHPVARFGSSNVGRAKSVSPHGAGGALRPAHADHLGHSLQLVDAGARRR